MSTVKQPETTTPTEVGTAFTVDLDIMEPPPFLGELETVLCHRCGEPFERSTKREHYYPPKVCRVQASPSIEVVICTEQPWVDPREEERLQRRISMHELLWWLRSQKTGATP
jgi:hypothetical protein